MKLKRSMPDDEIPTSSMADIAFLLIIYFMVTATFAATRGIDFALPKEDDTPPIVEKEDSVLIDIQPSGDLIVDTKPMEPEDVLEYLEDKLERNPKKPVIIKPHQESPYQYMVEIFDVLRQGKLVDGQLVTRDEIPGITDEDWDKAKSINISIPTQREIESFWF